LHSKKIQFFNTKSICRVILDRASTSLDDYWSNLDFTILDSSTARAVQAASVVEAVTEQLESTVASTAASMAASRAASPSAASVTLPSASPSKPSTSTEPLPPPPCKSDAEILGEITSEWLHFCPVYDGGDEFSDCQLPFEELEVDDVDVDAAAATPMRPTFSEPSAEFDFSQLSSSKVLVVDASSYVSPKLMSPIPSTSSIILPPPPTPPPLKTQRLALKDRIYQLQNNRGTSPNGPLSGKLLSAITLWF
jgi:hypothetical protein